MAFVFYDDTFIQASNLNITSSNRLFKYGDGLFESIYISAKKPLFIEKHIQRLIAGMAALEILVPPTWNTAYFTTILTELIKKNNVLHARCRITVCRSGEGLYTPLNNTPKLYIELSALELKAYTFNTKGLHLGKYSQLQIHPSHITPYKTANALTYVLAAKYAHEHKFDNVVIANTKNTIADTINANIFLIRKNEIITPPMSDGAINGIMKSVVMEIISKEGMPVVEKSITENDLLLAEELFLTNAIQGIQWIGKYEEIYYTNKISTEIFSLLEDFSNQ